ncbi:MAG: phosphomethylpyrimidine synthase ThiC [bacterium]|nr:phosphomethylpyrimidine synthase ThiC [bacterium]
MNQAKQGIITPEVELLARAEHCSPEGLSAKVASGKVAIPFNIKHRPTQPCAIGEGLKTKVNANLGTSPEIGTLEGELEKAKVALGARADTLMDLSIGGDTVQIRRAIIDASPVPVGTVPIYEAALKAGDITQMTPKGILETIRFQAEDGVDFMTIHAGITLQAAARLSAGNRIMEVVSRGGAILLKWMRHHKAENPLYAHFDEVLDILAQYDVTISLGDGLRPGCLADASDGAQFQELITLGELTRRAWARDISVIIEGPGHMPMDQIEANVLLQKRICGSAPFYVLGPLVTDVAPGYDHITAAIGGAIAARAGADFLCYVTPGEHLHLPTPEDVRDGVIASGIAAHAGDIAKGIPGAMDWDIQMSRCRSNLDWEGQIKWSINPEKTKTYCERRLSAEDEVCTMCGEYCALKVGREDRKGGI